MAKSTKGKSKKDDEAFTALVAAVFVAVPLAGIGWSFITGRGGELWNWAKGLWPDRGGPTPASSIAPSGRGPHQHSDAEPVLGRGRCCWLRWACACS